jgi:acyl-CoA thioesterase II
MSETESAWSKYPDHVHVLPLTLRARAWHGDLLLAESDACLFLDEVDHVDRLYFPERDVHFDLFEETDHHTVCPFKGTADYWTLRASDPPQENVLWGYRSPVPEMMAIKGYVCFYDERVRVEIEERWENEQKAVTTYKFPAWGDERDLLALMDVAEVSRERFVAPAYRGQRHQASRDVVEGGQLTGAAIVAAARTIPDQRVVAAHMLFPKAASFGQPVDLELEVLRQGRTFSSVEARFSQDGVLRSAGLLLLDVGSPDLFRLRAEMPKVAGPDESEPLDMGVTGRDLRVVDNAWSHDPDQVGPPEISIWVRFRDDPGEVCLHQALMAQSTTHWLGAAAMRPIPGVGLAQAHVTLSGGPMSVALTFHDEVDVTEWLLYSNVATYGGRGLTHGETRIFAEDGRLVGSFTVLGMLREFPNGQENPGGGGQVM